MSTRIRLRRADYANWTSDNPTLDYGEVGLVYDNGKLVGYKVGDGSTVFNTLKMHRAPIAGSTRTGLGDDGKSAEDSDSLPLDWDKIALLQDDNTFIAGKTQTFSGAVALDGGVTCDTDKFTIADTTGDTTTKGVLHVDNSADADVVKVNTDKFVVQGDDGAVTTAGQITTTNTTDAAGSGITVNDDKFTVNAGTGDIAAGLDGEKFTVAGATGNTVIAGTLAVTGAVTGTSTIVGTNDSYTADAVNTGATFIGSAIWRRTITVSAGSGLANIQPGDAFVSDVTDIDKLIKQEWHQCSMQWHQADGSTGATGSANNNHYLAGGAVSGNFNRGNSDNQNGITSFCVAALNRFDPRDGSTAASNSLFWAGIAGLDHHVGVADLVLNNDSGKTGIDAIVTIWYTKS